MGIKEDFRAIVADEENLARFISFVIRSSDDINTTQLAEVFNKNMELTEVRTYDGWKEEGRQVCYGSKGWAYLDIENSKYRNGLSYAFDIKQTKGHTHKPKELKLDEFNDVFDEIKEVARVCWNEDIEEFREKAKKILNIKENKKNGEIQDNRSSITRSERDSGNEIRLDNRTVDGDRRVSQTRKRASVGEQISFLEGIEETTQQIRLASGRISEISQLHEIYEASFNVDIGRRVVSTSRKNNEFQGREVGRISSTTERDISRESNSNDDVSLGNGTPNIQRVYSSVRYGLTEQDFVHRGPKERCHDNIEAIRIVKKLKLEERSASPEEQSALAKYVGWGGLPEVFDANNNAWAKEYAELKGLLSEDEYKSARDSVLNAHFTEKGIIDAIYAGLEHLGVKGGKALEPSCGTGNFIGCVPNGMDLQFDGVELDGLTADIAKALYPTENIKNSGFENVSIKDNTYDVVIGNVPFGDYRVYDSDYNKYKFVIHDYFIAKSLDKLKANGIMAIITGKGTLDKLTPTAREYFAQRAKLVGAFRLPNTAFKSSAGTEAVADILFFQKRENIVSIEEAKETESWISAVNEDIAPLNKYFIENPQNVIGEFKVVSGRFGAERTVVQTTDDLPTQLKSAVISSLPANIANLSAGAEASQDVEENTKEGLSKKQLDDMGIREFSLCLLNNKIYFRENNELVESTKVSLKKELEGKNLSRVKDYIELREQVCKIIDLQCENCSDEVLHAEQKSLNEIYDKYVKNYGFISDTTNRRFFEEDIDYPLVSSIENYKEEEKTAEKLAIFTQRTIRRAEKKIHTDDVYEALSICRSELGEVDIHYIEQLTGLSFDEVINKLDGQLYKNPRALFDEDKYAGWETRDNYLSGNVVEKLAYAEHSKLKVKNSSNIPDAQKNAFNEILDKNIKALEQVQPIPLKASDIRVRLGATWIDNEDYQAFIAQTLNASSTYGFEVIYNEFNGQFRVSAPSWIKQSAEAKNIYGTERMNAVDIFECALNNRPPTVWDKVIRDDKEKRVVNKAETAIAREKVREMNELFAKWVWERDATRREKYEKIYNRRFNSIVLPEYDGQHLTFDGMNACVELREHQKTAVARIASGKNTLLHHSVGAGKTFEIIAGAMKLRQYGIANKPMIVVPNPLVNQWAQDVKKLYPNAKILVTSKEQFEKQNRKRFISKIATGDWDMVIISESQFVRIPVSTERQLNKTAEIIERIREQLEDEAYKSRYRGGKSLTVKALTAILKKKETKYKELQDKISKIKDNVLPFEKLGVDYLFVDEAHLYKNKEIETSMSSVAGITSGGSERAFDLEMKIDYLSELHGGDKGVVFATGTPISNSMAEMYTMQSYLAKTELQKVGLQYFDAWASNFGEVVTSWELNTSGSGVKARTRFARFVNLPELQTLYRSFADVKTAEMLNLPVPNVERQTITIPTTEQITQFNDEIIARGERIERGGIDPTEDNMLKLSSDGKKLALDPRCFDSNAYDEENTKVNTCIKQVFDIYENTSADKLTQVIFCDQSTPKQSEWSVYQDIKDKLVALGVHENEIAFIHDADTDKKKEKLFAQMNSGEVRVLIGSTQKCGVGANFQKKLKALHHLDVPYRPADMEQREGRIIRQGNTNSNVEIYSYITEKTFDSYSYQILETKQRFISQINKGDMTLREASDIDEQTLSFAQIKAIATANPDFLRQMELVNTIKELNMLKSKFYENKDAMQRKLTRDLPMELAYVGNRHTDITKDLTEFYTDKPVLKLDGVEYKERSQELGETFMTLYNNARDGEVIGEYGGLKLVANKSSTSFILEKRINLKGNASYRVDLGDSGFGNITRIENTYERIPKMEEEFANKVENVKRQMDELSSKIDGAWDREDELTACQRELDEIEKRLQVNKDEVVEEVEDENSSNNEKSQNSKEKEENNRD